MNVLVIGRGSIGKKHEETLAALSSTYELSVSLFEPTTHEEEGYFAELAEALADKEVAFICNPTSKHLRTLEVCLTAGVHVFLEKPIAHRYEPETFSALATRMEETKRTVMVGYDMRFNPFIEKLHELVSSGAIGNVWSVRIMAGQYLPDWRPGSDYRSSYSAQKALGGGVLLDLSHELDYLLWLLPKPVRAVAATLENTGALEIDTEDLATVVVSYEDQSIAEVHLDYLTVPYRRSCEVYGTKGTLVWDDNAGTLTKYGVGSRAGEIIPVARRAGAEIFFAEVAHFFECIREGKEPLNSFVTSIEVMRLIDAARRSSESGEAVSWAA